MLYLPVLVPLGPNSLLVLVAQPDKRPKKGAPIVYQKK